MWKIDNSLANVYLNQVISIHFYFNQKLCYFIYKLLIIIFSMINDVLNYEQKNITSIVLKSMILLL